tara:strand:- start:85 stop:336 length:252 start_codon:yes stop_codon:yes gene_type:complete
MVELYEIQGYDDINSDIRHRLKGLEEDSDLRTILGPQLYTVFMYETGRIDDEHYIWRKASLEKYSMKFWFVLPNGFEISEPNL